MKKSAWLYLFAISLVLDLTGVCLRNETLVFVAKPLVVISLILYFISQTYGITTDLKKSIAGALIFSWIGDVLLMFESKITSLFIFGLIAFLIAHVFYIYFFAKIQADENIQLKWLLIILVLIYYGALILFLYSYLGKMRWPVKGYGFAISLMFLLALHMLFIKNKSAGIMMMAGALLFIVSDSVLAINKFYQPFEFAGVIIMLTYGLAQLLITTGAVRYLRSVNSN